MRYLASLALIAVVAAPIIAAPKPADTIAAAIANPARPADFKSADEIRKPGETLAFAGVKPGMTIGEFYPGGGYFTMMLSNVVGPKGHVYGLENDGWKGSADATRKRLGDQFTNVSIDSKPFGTVSFPKPLDLAWV